MAWGSSKVSAPPPPQTNLFFRLLPVIILFTVLGGAAFVGYHIYLTVQKIGDHTSKKLESKNVLLTKDGMKVSVKDVKTEHQVGNTQSYLVKAWNLSTWPAYQSKFWNKAPTPAATPAQEKRNPLSRHASEASQPGSVPGSRHGSTSVARPSTLSRHTSAAAT